MLNITGLNRFFFVRDFHDMRCKYDKVLSIIHQQLNREPEDGDESLYSINWQDVILLLESPVVKKLTVK